jgi:GT2 family glycosyltransferase
VSSTRLSFTIITYNRCDDLVDAVDSVLKQGFDDYEIVIVSNSTDDTEATFTGGNDYDRDEIRYFQFEGRMGVPRARNIAHEKARGDIYVTIDDDAELAHRNCAQCISDIFQENPDLGILAFKIRNAYTGEIESFPHRDSRRAVEEPFDTTYYVGCGHAIRADAIDDTGGYPDEFHYGSEELDLSFRILDSDYRIRYDPSVEVLHKESPEGRRRECFYTQKMIENRIRLAVRNVPWRYAVVYLTVWTVYTLYASRFDFSAVAWGWMAALRDMPSLLDERDVISPETVRYIRSRSGRLYY